MSFCRAENLHCFLLFNRILKLSIPPEDLCSLSLPEPVHGLKTTPHGYAIAGGGGGGEGGGAFTLVGPLLAPWVK